jgi:molybdate transport system ATP-binding protein
VSGQAGYINAAFRGRLGTFGLDVAFNVRMRGITALFGPSGCGKTTILRCIAGLQHLEGHLYVDGEPWQDSAVQLFKRPHTRAVGYVFQEASLFPHLSVRENLLYGAKRALHDGGRRRSFDDIVELLRIGALLERAPATLSGGERSRVAIGTALLSQPRLLLLDEPLTGLDQHTKEEILPYLATLQRELSIPVLYVSHEIDEVARLADHMLVLSAGKLIASGATAEVLAHLELDAVCRYEAGVVITARVVRHEHELKLTHLEHGGQPIVIPAIDVSVGTDVRLRIRAREVALATQRPTGISIRNMLAGTIVEIVEEPNTAYAEAWIDIGTAKVRSRLTRAAVRDLGLRPGLPVYALIKSVTFDGRPVPVIAPSASDQ